MQWADYYSFPCHSGFAIYNIDSTTPYINYNELIYYYKYETTKGRYSEVSLSHGVKIFYSSTAAVACSKRLWTGRLPR